MNSRSITNLFTLSCRFSLASSELAPDLNVCFFKLSFSPCNLSITRLMAAITLSMSSTDWPPAPVPTAPYKIRSIEGGWQKVDKVIILADYVKINVLVMDLVLNKMGDRGLKEQSQTRLAKEWSTVIARLYEIRTQRRKTDRWSKINK